jgi:hypothetical protein
VTLARFPFIKTINDPDVLYAITDLSILACAEVGTCIIATSAGTWRPLFVRHPDASGQPDLPALRRQPDMAHLSEVTETTTIPTDLESMGGAPKPVKIRIDSVHRDQDP